MAILFLQTRFPLSLRSQPHRYLFPNPDFNPNHSFLTIPFTSTNTNSLVRLALSTGSSAGRNLNPRSPPSPSQTKNLELPEAFIRLAVSAVLFLCFGLCYGVRVCSASSPAITTGAPSVQEEQTSQDGQDGRKHDNEENVLDKESEAAFNAWKSKTFALTVPLKVVALRGSVPPSWVKDFINSQGKRLKFNVKYHAGLEDIFSHLSYSTTSIFGAQGEFEEGNVDMITNGENGSFGKNMGSGFFQGRELSNVTSRSTNGDGHMGQNFSFGSVDYALDADDEEEEEGRSSDDDVDVEFLSSFNGNRNQIPQGGESVGIGRIEISEDEFRHPLVREVCRLIALRSAWSPRFEGHLRYLLRRLKPPHVCAVLRSQTDERVALNFFYWADRQWRYRHDTVVYYTMLDVLSRTKLCQGAKRILQLMIRRGIKCSPEAFGYVMVSYSRAQNLRYALRVLTLMQKAGVEPNLSICNTAIYVLVKSNKLEKALRFLKRMQLTGIKPNVVTYNCLIKGYCDLNRVEDALELIAEMPSKGCAPDKVSYYTMMAFLCTEKKIKEVRQLMEKMVVSSKLIPDQVTYNTIIHMLSKHGHADDALAFLREAEDKGFRIDKVGYSAVINSFCKKGMIDETKSLVNDMYSRGCFPDVVTYTTVIDGFCRTGKIDEAKKMLQQMCKRGCKPNTVSYTALLNGLCHNGKSQEAREMLNVSEEHWWTPNAISYSAVMHGLRREGKLSEACDLVREMVGKGLFPTPVEINQLIQSLCQNQKVVDAKNFLEECLNKGCAINVVNFTTVIHGFCQISNLEAALSVLDDMYLINKHPDAVTYTTLFDALGKKGRLDEAGELMMKMLSKGLDPTPVTYRTVIHHYCQWGRLDDMLKILEKMLVRQPFRAVYNQVIEKLCGLGNPEEAEKHLGNVLRTASKLDATTCHILMESYLKKGASLSAYRVTCRMFSRNLVPDLKLCEKLRKRLMLDGKLVEADNLMLRLVERGMQQNEIHL